MEGAQSRTDRRVLCAIYHRAKSSGTAGAERQERGLAQPFLLIGRGAVPVRRRPCIRGASRSRSDEEIWPPSPLKWLPASGIMRIRLRAGFSRVGGCPSGQREQTVNLSAQPTEVQILPPPPYDPAEWQGPVPGEGRLAWRASIAQLAEHFHGKEGVLGSNPSGGSMRVTGRRSSVGQSSGIIIRVSEVRVLSPLPPYVVACTGTKD